MGDFASAGAVEIDYLNKLPKNLAEITFGSFGYGAGSPRHNGGRRGHAARRDRGHQYNGPWDVPDDVRKINGVLRYSQGTATEAFR